MTGARTAERAADQINRSMTMKITEILNDSPAMRTFRERLSTHNQTAIDSQKSAFDNGVNLLIAAQARTDLD